MSLSPVNQWKEQIWKGYMPSDFNYNTFCKRQNYADSKKVSGPRDEGAGEEWTDRAQGIFRAVKLCVKLCVMMGDMCHTFIQTHRMYTTKSEP